MKTITTLLAAALALALGGCAHVNHASLQTKSFAISAGTKPKTTTTASTSRGGPPHCPPGHAKKGEC